MKTLQIQLTDDEHRQLKIAAAAHGLTLKQLVLLLTKEPQFPNPCKPPEGA